MWITPALMGELVPQLHGRWMHTLLSCSGFAPTEQFMFIHTDATNVRLRRSPVTRKAIGSSANLPDLMGLGRFEYKQFGTGPRYLVLS